MGRVCDLIRALQRRGLVGFELPACYDFDVGGQVRTAFCVFLKLRLTSYDTFVQ
jgi:hypothetical protein